MRRAVIALVLIVAGCAGLGPRAQLAAVEQSFTVIVDRLDRSCVAAQLAAAQCSRAQIYVQTGRDALDAAYAAVDQGNGSADYLGVVVSVTEELEAILARRRAP